MKQQLNLNQIYGILFSASLVSVACCRTGTDDYSGTYVRHMENAIVSLSDTIVLEQLPQGEGKAYTFERRLLASYKDGETPADRAVSAGTGYYDKKAEAIIVEKTEQTWYINHKKGTLQSGANRYFRPDKGRSHRAAR